MLWKRQESKIVPQEIEYNCILHPDLYLTHPTLSRRYGRLKVLYGGMPVKQFNEA